MKKTIRKKLGLVNLSIYQFIILFFLTSQLPGCIFVAGAAAGAAAIAIVYDHRSISNGIKDAQIANKIADKIRLEPNLHVSSHIEIAVFNHVVLLIGQTPNPSWKEQASYLASSVADVSRIYNQISIEGPTSSLTRTSDTWITTKVKTQLLTAENLKSGSIKVVTENGTVYLMGIVTHAQADLAVEIARDVSGVKRVIKVFQYQ